MTAIKVYKNEDRHLMVVENMGGIGRYLENFNMRGFITQYTDNELVSLLKVV